eukprot:4814849-Amphidinium_carterae.2
MLKVMWLLCVLSGCLQGIARQLSLQMPPTWSNMAAGGRSFLEPVGVSHNPMMDAVRCPNPMMDGVRCAQVTLLRLTYCQPRCANCAQASTVRFMVYLQKEEVTLRCWYGVLRNHLRVPAVVLIVLGP